MVYLLLFLTVCYIIIKSYLQPGLHLFDYLIMLSYIVIFVLEKIKFQREKRQLISNFQKDKDFITEITHALRTTLEFNELLKMILNTLSNRLRHKNIFIYLLDRNEEKEYLKCIGFPGAIDINGIDTLNIPSESELINISKRQTDSKILNLDSPRYETERKILQMNKIGIVSMSSRGESIGAIIFGITSENMDFSDIKIFAVHSALAIENAKLYEKVKESAIMDKQTNIYNRRYFDQALVSGIDLAKRYKSFLSLLMIDIDDFKHYNDKNGHLAGDDCLYRVAQILVANTWKTDVVARYGGEEFAVILHGTPPEGAGIAAEKLRKAVENYKFPYGINQPQGKITVSIGVSSFPNDTTDPRELVYCADQALYIAKRTGKNRVCIFSEYSSEFGPIK